MASTSKTILSVVLLSVCSITVVIYNLDLSTPVRNRPMPRPYNEIHLTAKKENNTGPSIYQLTGNYAKKTQQIEEKLTGMINASTTIVKLKSPNKTIKVGDFFSVIIEARDKFGRQLTKGDDFFFASITNRKARGSGAGKITDFNNGTYEAIFYAAWSGILDITIILVHPSDTVDYIDNELWPMEGRIEWKGYFRSQSTYSTCRFSRNVLLDKCNYSHPLATGKTAFYCDKQEELRCDTLIRIKSFNDHVENMFTKLFSSHKSIFDTSVTYVRLNNGINSISISSDEKWKFSENVFLPKCKPDLPIPSSDGFWSSKIWTSLQCETKQWTKHEISECIKGKNIILMGDSTTRQWAEGLQKFMKLTGRPYNTNPNAKHIRHRSQNMTFDCYTHPYTIGVTGYPYRVGKWEYEILDNLNFSMCNYIIIVSPWAHYTQWTKESYIERLKLLRETVIRFMKRCPNAPVLVKTPHPRNHKSDTSLLYSSDKLLYNIYNLYYRYFSGIGVHIIDIWDMNLAHPHVNTIHMPMEVIFQELFMMFSHICPVN